MKKVLIFITLCLVFLSFVPSGNEWHYTGLAKHWFNPDWSANTFLFDESASHRIVWQSIFGLALTVFSFEQVAFLGNLVVITLLSLVLSKIYNRLNYGEILLHLAFFLYVDQTFAGQENMLLGFESRHFAYVSALLAYYYMDRQEFGKSGILTSLTAVIHIGVGLFLFPIYLIYIRKDLIKYWRYILGYLSVIVAMYFMMDVNVDTYFYSQVRQAHHSLSSVSVIGFLSITSFLGAFILYYRKRDTEKLLLTVYVLVLCLASYLDTYGYVDKYFPTRIASFALFILLLDVIKNQLSNPRVLALVAAGILLPIVKTNIDEMKYYRSEEPVYTEIRKLPKDAVILDVRTSPISFNLDYDLEHKTQRQVYFNFKYVNLSEFNEWKRRLDKLLVDDFSEVDYLITKQGIKQLQ